MLKEYKKKRNFRNTPEPAGRRQTSGDHLRFVVQRHDATRLHYDFRLELDGVLKSWAVPKGPSMNPADKRLAVQVEDHPVDYIDFAGVIPEGNYGAGVVQIWDHGVYVPVNADIEPISEKEALKWLKNGEIKFVIRGKKLSGEFVLVRLRDEKNWLLIKHNDEYAVDDPYDAEQLIRGKSKKEVFAKGAKGEKVWQSNRAAGSASGTATATRKKSARRGTSAAKKAAAAKKRTASSTAGRKKKAVASGTKHSRSDGADTASKAGEVKKKRAAKPVARKKSTTVKSAATARSAATVKPAASARSVTTAKSASSARSASKPVRKSVSKKAYGTKKA